MFIACNGNKGYAKGTKWYVYKYKTCIVKTYVQFENQLCALGGKCDWL